MVAITAPNQFGIQFVEDAEVPEAPRKNDRNDALWLAVTVILKSNPGKFAKVKTYSSATGAAQKASTINSGRNKKFAPTPEGSYEARYTSDRDKDESVLYLAWNEIQKDAEVVGDDDDDL